MNENLRPAETRPEQDEVIIDTSGMSEGRRAALELEETSRESRWQYPTFAGGLFMGAVPLRLIYPFPEKPTDRDERGEHFLYQLENYLRDHVHPDQIDRTGEIPEPVLEGLARLGAFGIQIPREYGGLGLSQSYYSRAVMILGSYCSNLSALLSAHQSIGIPQPLLLFGTEEQKLKYLPRVARGEISAFALTESGVGSDPARMTTAAQPAPDGEHFVLNGKKLWCINGTRARLLLVMAKTPPKLVAGHARDQITAFIVEADTPGVTVTHRCRFMGLHALYNAEIEFTDVYVPRANILFEEGKGLRVALTTLNTGRLTLPAACTGAAKRAIDTATRRATERVQWGAPIGRHAAIADKLARMAALSFATEAMTRVTSLLVDRKESDIRLEAAMCKMFGSEAAWWIANETMQILGGRGYETDDSLRARGEIPNGIERMVRDSRINMIFGGTSEIMRLFIAREAIDPHLEIAGELVNPKTPFRRKLRLALKVARFYCNWYPRQFLPTPLALSGLDARAKKQMRYVARTSKKLSRKLFLTLAQNGLKLEREQVLLGRFVDIGTELFAQAASCSFAQHLIDQGTDRREVQDLLDLFCQGSRIRIADAFRRLKNNADRAGYELAQQMVAGRYRWLTAGKLELGPPPFRITEETVTARAKDTLH